MDSLLSKLSGTTKPLIVEPRDIFMALPQREKGYEYPRDVQSEVWEKWSATRSQKDCVIKMNTGSGKTVVGLLILQSCLNEGKGPAIYVVPDNYLVSQVCSEARKIGISVTDNRDDYSYTEKKAILVTNIYNVINGHSVFGMRQNNNYPIGSILFDDVHACIDTITDSFSIKISASHELYSKIVKLFETQWKDYDSRSYFDIVNYCDPVKSALIPYWVWQEKQAEIYELLASYCNDDELNRNIYFNLPLIKDSLNTCDCFITCNSIEIIPEGINLSLIKSLENAQRRIFMSATLADDSVFISTLGLKRESITEIIVPAKADDIGDRLILFPRHLNNEITDDDIKRKVFAISASHNVVVIVPSTERAKYWDPDEVMTINKQNIESEIAKLNNGHVGLKVLVNRYDGIDLPDDACRMLVIDGLPPIKNAKEKYITSIDSESNILKKEQIQRIEQGMGRGVRSNNDSCCVVLMGNALSDVLLRTNGLSFFSNATKEQYNLSKELWDLLKDINPKPSVDDVFNLAAYSLDRRVEWITKSKERLSTIKYSSTPSFDEVIVSLRSAYEKAINSQIINAVSVIDAAINKQESNSTKGYLLQVKAKYVNLYDKSKSQQILLSGKGLNHSILSPMDGIRYDKTLNNTEQARAICNYLEDMSISQNDFLIYIESILSQLVFSPDSVQFEIAIRDIGKALGFTSTLPDQETNGRGPDNLWALGNNNYLVIECKSGAVANTISKDYCNQLDGSMRWFNEEYGSRFSAIPIIIHPSTIIDKQATPVSDMRVIEKAKLEYLKKQVHDLAVALSQDNNWKNETNIASLLIHYKLRNIDIVNNYTCLPNRI